jgi:hypothetical protein
MHPPSLDELQHMERELQIREQRRIQEESKSSAPDNEESDSLSSSTSRPRSSFTAVSEQLPTQSQLQQESRNSALDNEESDSLSSSTSRPRSSFTTASEQLPTQRQLQQESRNSARDNEGSDSLCSGELHSLPVAPRGSHGTSMTAANLRSILNSALAVLDESDDDDLNSHS